MRSLWGTRSPQTYKLLRICAWVALIIVLLASLPFLIKVLGHGIDWLTGLLPNPERLWERVLWLR